MDAVDIDTSEPQQSDEDHVVSTVHVCRVCLLSNLIMRDLFAEGDITLSTKAMSFASVKMLPGDGLPSQVCCECADKLESAYEFKLQVEQADSVLRERYDSLNIKAELFFNEVEVHLEADRPEEVSEMDVTSEYEAAATVLESEVNNAKADTLLKNHLALLHVDKLSQHEQHVLEHAHMVADDGSIRDHILHGEEQYIEDPEHHDEQMLADELEPGECSVDEHIKSETMQETINVAEHNYIVQQQYTLSSEQEQELLNEENVPTDADAAEYLSLIDDQEIVGKDDEHQMKKSDEECICDEDCELEDNQQAFKIERPMSRQSCAAGEAFDEENYFENLNLSSRLTQYQVDRSNKVFFMCYLCDKQFRSKDVLKEHMHSHEEVRQTICLKKSTEKGQKIPASPPKVSPPSGKKPNKCPYCGKEYLYVISFNKHVKQHQKNEEPPKEDVDTVNHMEDSMGSDSFDDNSTFEVITMLKEEPEREGEANENQDTNPSKKRRRLEFYSCETCNENFSTQQELSRHCAQHILLKCNICLEEFYGMEKLRNHRTAHVMEGVISEEEVKEELAEFSNANFNAVEQSIELSAENATISDSLEGAESYEFKCPCCSLVFDNKKTLTKHQQTHESVRYRCKICGDEFTEKDQLQKHADQHSPNKSFKCTECTKIFANELTLRNHLIATNHKTIIRGEEYDPNKRIKRIAAKAAQKIIDKISTEDGLEDSDKEDDNDEFTAEEKKSERLQGSSRKSGTKKDLECGICGKKCISKHALGKHMEYHMNTGTPEQDKEKKTSDIKSPPKTCVDRFLTDDDDDDDDNNFNNGMDWPLDNHECSKCKKRYSTKKSLMRHQLLHEDPNFECDICNVKFYRKDKLKAHYDKCSEKNPDQVRKCNICGDVFENNEILREHRSMHVNEGLITEEDLRELEPGSEERRQGEKTARKRRTDIVGLECPECNKQYTSRKGLLRHIQVHEGKKYLCEICPKKFYRREHLKIHVAKHNMVKPFKCSRCPKRFIKEEQLTAHSTKHDKTFKKNKDTESTAKRWLCEICSKSFTQSTTLVAHLRAHKGIKPYVCEVCARPFTTNAYLKMHMRTHTHERPYSCQYCTRAFARADTLANHLTSHTGEAKYQCKHCPKTFRRLKSLKEHVYIHTGQRPYACPTCDRKFNNNGSRYAHSKRCKQNLLQNQARQTQAPQVEHVEQPEPAQQPIRITQNVAPAMQVLQSKNIKTITITRQPDQVTGHQLMQPEILMPLILPLTVTLTDVDEEVILPEGTKIFTTT